MPNVARGEPPEAGRRCGRMRTMPIIITAFLVLANSARAQDKTWTPAPVPSIGRGDTIMPAARAGSPIEDDHATPFSSIPSGSTAAGGATSSDQQNGVQTPTLSK